jgi:hypothetical protein
MLVKIYAKRGDVETCLQCLRKAKEDGYRDLANVYKDEEFSRMRENPRLHEVVARLRLSNIQTIVLCASPPRWREEALLNPVIWYRKRVLPPLPGMPIPGGPLSSASRP